MAGGSDALDQTVKRKFSSYDQPLDSMVAPATSKSSRGSTEILNFGADAGLNRSGNSFFRSFDQEEILDEYLDEYFNQPEKKRRLSADQVQFLERSFEEDNKLEPDRKIQLAEELGLQPRQISVWFQNRRARWKTRQLETDYETLHASYKTLKTDYDNLLKENEKLKSEVIHLKQNGLARDTKKADMPDAMPEEAFAHVISEDEESKVSAMAFTNEGSLAKSEVLDSPRLMDGIHSSLIESSDSSRVVEPDYSDLSQNGEDDLNEGFLPPDYIFPKIEDAHSHQPVSSFYYGFLVEDHAFSFWPY